MKNLIKIIFLFTIATFSQQLNSQCVNEALDFDGANDAVSNTLPTSYSNFTVSAWFNSSSVINGGTEDRIFSIGSPRLEIGLGRNSNEGLLWILDNQIINFPTGNLHDDTWHQVTYRKDGINRSMFLDGLIVGSWTAPSNLHSGHFNIGHKSGDGYFKGIIDDVAFYDTALPNSQISDIFNCSPSGSEPNLIGYWPFENGDPGNNNSGITTTPDVVGGFGDGTLFNFALTGASSNFVCPTASYVEACVPSACFEDTLIISTGYNPFTESAFTSTGTQDGYWNLIEAPGNNGNVNLNSPAYHISKDRAWSPPPYNSRYISAFPVPGMNEANISTALPPYTFRRCFCVEEDNTELEFSIDVHVDNQVALYFYDPNNPTGRFLLDELPTSSTSNFKGPPEHMNISNYTVPTAGSYCIEAELRNDNPGSPMGLNISGWVKGASIITDQCCSNQAYITGFKVEDDDCDGTVSINDPKIENYTIELYDDSNALITSMVTDVNGYYVFAVDPGTYTVKEVLQSDYEYSVPANGEYSNVAVTANEVVQLNFGNIYTGPIVTEALDNSCAVPGDDIDFAWTGQVCDCDLILQMRMCGSSEDWENISDMTNTGSYTWESLTYLQGNKEFQILDCDGNEVPFNGCVNFADYEIQIQALQTGCGVYDFSPIVTGMTPTSYAWSFGVIGSASSINSSFTFNEAGEYEIKLMVEDAQGCLLTESVVLSVDQGASDPNCQFCPPNVMGEIQNGDMYLDNSCYGVIITSPNGNCFRITVSDDGQLTAQSISCP